MQHSQVEINDEGTTTIVPTYTTPEQPGSKRPKQLIFRGKDDASIKLRQDRIGNVSTFLYFIKNEEIQNCRHQIKSRFSK
jgi:hypothetical protein